MVSHMHARSVIVRNNESVDDVYRRCVANCYMFHALYDPAATSSFVHRSRFVLHIHTLIDHSVCHTHNHPCKMADLALGSGSASSSCPFAEDSSPRQSSPERPSTISTSVNECSQSGPADRISHIRRSDLQLRTESRYNPRGWKCKGYGPADEYVYFDGAEGTSDLRFLIDLESPSMERLVGHSCTVGIERKN
jgi:hypothetical protein